MFVVKMRECYKILLYAILLTGITPLWGQESADSLSVYFRYGCAVVEPSLRENCRTIETIENLLRESEADSSRRCVEMRLEGGASPDGTTAANMRLSRKRVFSMLDYLRGRISVPDSLISVRAVGVDWNGLVLSVEKDTLCPARAEVLDILYHTPEWIYDARNRIVDGRKRRLMQLHGGVPYNYLREKFFPDLRKVSIVLRYEPAVTDLQEEYPGSLAVSSDASETAEPERVESCVRLPEVSSESPSVSTVDAGTVPLCETSPVESPTSSDSVVTERNVLLESTGRAIPPLHRMAIKTNLLYDALLMPSLEVEYRIDDRWSVAVEGSVAWWSKNRTHKYYQIATIVPEGRYWFGVKKPWHGHYVGVFVGGSWYDLENGARGYKGEFFMTGISYGYMFPVGRSLSLEAGLGVGFLRTSYEEYLPIDGHYVYQQTSRTNWFGPVRLKFALVWRLWNQNKAGK